MTTAPAANPIRLGPFADPHVDLRDWIARVEGIGELMRVSGVDWNLEMGAVAEMIYHARPENPPAIFVRRSLFESAASGLEEGLSPLVQSVRKKVYGP